MDRDYDYPAKNVVREMGVRFIPPHLPDMDTRTALYLPAPQNLELPGYLDLGFRVENLLGAENNERRMDETCANANGVTVFRGSVRSAVAYAIETGRSPFTSVNLDFDGSYHTNIQDLLSVFRVFPAAPAGYLRVTSYAARDDEAIQQGIVNTSKFRSGLNLDYGRFMQQYGVMVQRFTALRNLLDSRTPDHTHLSRELGFLWWMVIGMGVVSYGDDGVGTLDETFVEEVAEILDRITTRVARIAHGTEFALVDEPALAAALADRKCELWPRSLERIAYHTRRNQPMRTWHLEVCRVRPGEEYSLQEVLEQVWQLALRSPLLFVHQSGMVHSIDVQPEFRRR